MRFREELDEVAEKVEWSQLSLGMELERLGRTSCEGIYNGKRRQRVRLRFKKG